MTTITIERAVVHRALSALEYHTQQTRPIHNTELAIEELRDALAAPATAPEQDVHPDDKAVDRFAERMKWKLANARAKGKSGWQDRAWTPEQISAALRQHVDKGDPTDVANYCMFLSARAEPITPATAPDRHAQELLAMEITIANMRERHAQELCAYQITVDKLRAERRPMRDDEIMKLFDRVRMQWVSSPPTYEAAPAFARAVEAFHGIAAIATQEQRE